LNRFVITDDNGGVHIQGICKVAGLGGDPYRDGSYAYYVATEVTTDDPKGVGAFILAAVAVSALGDGDDVGEVKP
jgi:unsaturated rhamnogalacturonyl hydrolase